MLHLVIIFQLVTRNTVPGGKRSLGIKPASHPQIRRHPPCTTPDSSISVSHTQSLLMLMPLASLKLRRYLPVREYLPFPVTENFTMNFK